MSKIKMLYIAVPVARNDEDERKREARIAELSARARRLGYEPCHCASSVRIGERLETVASCDGLLLDGGWKKCRMCVDEHAIASNHKLTFFHTKEEWDSLLESYVI